MQTTKTDGSWKERAREARDMEKQSEAAAKDAQRCRVEADFRRHIKGLTDVDVSCVQWWRSDQSGMDYVAAVVDGIWFSFFPQLFQPLYIGMRCPKCNHLINDSLQVRTVAELGAQIEYLEALMALHVCVLSGSKGQKRSWWRFWQAAPR